MGFSVTMSHIIMVIGSVVLASFFSSYALYTGNLIQNTMIQDARDTERKLSLELEIVYATIDNSTTPEHFVIYAKNVGWSLVNNYTYLDVYVGEYSRLELYAYNPMGTPRTFNLTDTNNNDAWEPRETVTIRAYPESNITGVMFEARIVPFRGMGSTYLFAAPP